MSLNYPHTKICYSINCYVSCGVYITLTPPPPPPQSAFFFVPCPWYTLICDRQNTKGGEVKVISTLLYNSFCKRAVHIRKNRMIKANTIFNSSKNWIWQQWGNFFLPNSSSQPLFPPFFPLVSNYNHTGQRYVGGVVGGGRVMGFYWKVSKNSCAHFCHVSTNKWINCFYTHLNTRYSNICFYKVFPSRCYGY